MLAQRPVILASWLLLNVAVINGVSVIARSVPCAWRWVPHAANPSTRSFAVAVAALWLQCVPVTTPPARVATHPTTSELGTEPVTVLLRRSRCISRWTTAFGVTRQEQHEI